METAQIHNCISIALNSNSSIFSHKALQELYIQALSYIET
jgi:hypothetical protein